MKRILVIAALAATLAVPFLLRPRQAATRQADDTLVIVTPHNADIRQEFEAGFEPWYEKRTGRTVAIDWRVLGGTSDIAHFLEGQYVASFRNFWTGQLGRPWSAEIQTGFEDGHLPENAPRSVKDARAAFLQSEVGCGIDLFFGGGTYDYVRQAAAGQVVDSGIRQIHPDWFAPAVIPQNFGGNAFRDPGDRWVGVALSSFGIIYNRQAWRRLGLGREPDQWMDLADPRLVGELALCDPTRSATMAVVFENIIQQQMQQLVAKGAPEREAVREGWISGMRLVQKLAANARYFTDSAEKIPIDVADGDCAAGMCIDFYSREEDEAMRRRGDPGRLGFVSPVGGTAYSADSIALLRGAQNRRTAIAFIEYTLSMEGQMLWGFRAGVPGGPREFPLRRPPIRRDFYARESWKPWRSDPDENPYANEGQFIYHPAWTNPLYREMAFIIRVMCEDTHDELAGAWRAIIAAPEPQKGEALAALQDMSLVNYERTGREIKQALESKDKIEEVRLARDLGDAFRRQYARAADLARGAATARR